MKNLCKARHIRSRARITQLFSSVVFIFLLSILASCVPCQLQTLKFVSLQGDSEMKPQMDSMASGGQIPEMIGGVDFIRKHLRYPERARQNCLQATVTFSMIIDDNGKVQQVQAQTDDAGWGFNQAGQDVLSKTKWVPAMKNGKPVKVRISIPIHFKLR